MPNPQTNATTPPANPGGGYLAASPGTMSQRTMWLWRGQRLEIEQGKEHGGQTQWAQANVEQFFRGWFDPEGRILFVVRPRRPDAPALTPVRGIPRLLDRALHRQFGDVFQYRLF